MLAVLLLARRDDYVALRVDCRVRDAVVLGVVHRVTKVAFLASARAELLQILGEGARERVLRVVLAVPLQVLVRRLICRDEEQMIAE